MDPNIPNSWKSQHRRVPFNYQLPSAFYPQPYWPTCIYVYPPPNPSFHPYFYSTCFQTNRVSSSSPISPVTAESASTQRTRAMAIPDSNASRCSKRFRLDKAGECSSNSNPAIPRDNSGDDTHLIHPLRVKATRKKGKRVPLKPSIAGCIEEYLRTRESEIQSYLCRLADLKKEKKMRQRKEELLPTNNMGLLITLYAKREPLTADEQSLKDKLVRELLQDN